MSDTDTDDTDRLLQIPPTCYTHTMRAAAADADADARAMPPPAVPPASTTAAYQFLIPSKKTELNHINARLQNMELEREHHFDAPSDISTISSSTVRTALGSEQQQHPREWGLVHSTPKCGSVADEPARNRRSQDNILLEIDNYLDERNSWPPQQHHEHYSEDYMQVRGNPRQKLPASQEQQPSATSLPSIRLAANDSKLISLSDLWGKSNLGGTVIGNANASNMHGSPSLKEEQLRRQHLEKMVQTLQAQLLEYQQRISVALEVDRSKDAALQQADKQSKSLNFEVQHLRDTVHRLEAERSEDHNRFDSLQHELSQAVGLATKFQEKTEKLETELERSRHKSNDATLELEKLNLQLQSSKRAEELSHAELNKLRDKFAKADYQQEKVSWSISTFNQILSNMYFPQMKTRIEELEKDNSTLQQQKEMLQEYHQKQKTRADNLENQRKSMQEALSNLTDIEVRRTTKSLTRISHLID